MNPDGPAAALVVLADRPAAGGARPPGGPAALLACAPGRPVLGAVLGQAAGLGLPATAVLTRRDWREPVAGAAGDGVDVVGYADLAGALAELAVELEQRSGPVLLVPGELVCSRDALADVAADPRLGTAALVRPAQPGRLRVAEGRVLAAGSAEHAIGAAGHEGLGVLRVADADRAELAAAARELAGLAMVHGWDADPLELLLLAAVRRELVVTAVALGDYVAERPRTAEQAGAAAGAVDALDDHAVRLARVARPDDGFYSTFVLRRVSPRLTALAVRAGWTPNAITFAALGVAAVAAACFATGARAGLIAGALLLQVSLVVDCMDGEVARYTRRFTALGGWLDATTDRVKEYGVYAALAIGASRAGDGAWTLAAAALALQVFRNVVDFGFVVTVADRKAALRGRRVPLAQTSDPETSDSGRPDGGGAAALGRGAVSLSERTSASPALKWAKRMVFLPIGERWLIISVLAAVSGARAVFAVLIGLGLLSAVYATAGRVLRAFAAAPTAPTTELADLADLGPLARALRAPAQLGGRFGWLLPGLLRGLEYGLVVAVVAAGDSAAVPAAFGYLAALAYHHYDTVYRWRHARQGPARWVFAAGLGVEGRLLLLGVLLLVTRDLQLTLGVLAAGFGALFVAESAWGWRAWLRTGPAPEE